MVVVISLSERNQRDEPAVPAGILCSMGLTAPEVADGIDAKGGVQDGEGSSHAGKQKTPDAADQSVRHKADHKCQRQAAKYDECVVFMLPDGHRILRDAGGILHVVILPFREEPATMAVPEPQFRVVGIAFLVALGMVAKVVCGPLDGTVLQRPRACDKQRAFHPVGAIKTAVRHQTMIAHGDSKAADEVEDAEQCPVQPGVIVVIGISRDREESSHHDGEKEDDRPADMVTASQA